MRGQEGYAFITASSACVPQLMQWFPTATSCHLWGGVDFRFPFTLESFIADCQIERLASYVLIDPLGYMSAFGQYYLRLDRCHLGRLVVAPSVRGCGLGTQLVRCLAQQGSRALGVSEISLFVAPANAGAESLYARLGLRREAYPDRSVDPAIYHYMVARVSALLAEPASA